MLAYGQGRSYGDVCLNGGRTLLHTVGLNHFLAFDKESGVLHCEAGATLKDVLDLIVPCNWFLPVTPGTKFVTVGGAIANDVHGKNHHGAGTFGNHVLSFTLRRSSGELLTCSPTENRELFMATIGGLGLTGLIVSVQVRLIPISNAYMSAERVPMHNVEEFFEISRASERDYAYTVAWVDGTAHGAKLGRGVFFRANHAATAPERIRKRSGSTHRCVPLDIPQFVLNPRSVAAFNQLYYLAQIRRRRPRLESYESFFYPLDTVDNWNRIYGARGFYQYQCVVPPEERDALKEMLRVIAAAGGGSFLAVLKMFGNVASPGLMSFPRPGPTLALDFPNRGERTLALFERLDEIVHAAGGALYPAKDARMSGRMFRASFPRYEEFARQIDPSFTSSFWRRVDAAPC